VTSPVARLLAESFEAMRSGLPPANEAFCRALAGCAVELRVDDEEMAVRFDAGGASVVAAAGAADARIDTGRRAILDVIDARMTLEEAVRLGRVQVVGPLPVVVRLHEGILLYVHGGVRLPAFASLLRRFRALAGGDHAPPGGGDS
jgi:hypothetical protein